MTKHPSVPKTIKLFVGGKFPRTESGRSFPVHFHNSEKIYAHLCLASRKDLRETVESARGAQESWSHMTAYNRGQILYRMAEMLSGKASEFGEVFEATLGWTDAKTQQQISETLTNLIYYAGFCDKFSQIVSTVNPVGGPYSCFSNPEPVGVVLLIPTKDFDLPNLVGNIASILTGGNSVLVLLDQAIKSCPAVIAPLSEVMATSDLPGGVVNFLTCDTQELLSHAGGHMDIRAISVQENNSVLMKEIELLSVGNLKRVVHPHKESRSLDTIMKTVEIKTVWQPVGF